MEYLLKKNKKKQQFRETNNDRVENADINFFNFVIGQ